MAAHLVEGRDLGVGEGVDGGVGVEVQLALRPLREQLARPVAYTTRKNRMVSRVSPDNPYLRT